MNDYGTFVFQVWYQSRQWIIELGGTGFPYGTLILAMVGVSVAAGFAKFVGKVIG